MFNVGAYYKPVVVEEYCQVQIGNLIVMAWVPRLCHAMATLGSKGK